MRIDGLTLGQLEAIGAEVFGTTTEVHGRSQNLVYVVLALSEARAEVERLTKAQRDEHDELARLREKADQYEAHAITVDSALRDREEVERLRAALRGEHRATMEAMASAEHHRWARWYLWQRDHSTPENLMRWDRLAYEPYERLDDATKQKDRDEVLLALAAALPALGGK